MGISVITTSIRPNGLERVRNALIKQSYRNFEWIVDLNWTGEVDFNRACNRAIKRANGNLIVFIQDYIAPNEHGLQMFWDAYQEHPDTFFTAPVGQITPGADVNFVEWDWRKHRDDMDWKSWEIDWGAAPRHALERIGGFDEALDEYWGFDNVNVGLRADMAGYKFKCLRENDAIGVIHDLIEPHPFRELRNPDFHNERLDDIRRGEWIPYL